MAELLFRQGELSQLFDANGAVKDFKEGSLNFTIDEPAIYLDVKKDGSDQRLRIGDIREFASIAEIEKYLEKTQGQIPSSGLYYAISENVLMKFDGTSKQWKQINLTEAQRATIASDISALQTAVGTAQTKANEAYTLAGEANTNAETRVLKTEFETFKDSNTDVIDAVRVTAQQGVTDAAGALGVAQAAGTAAGTAQAAAETAQKRADAAYTLAEEGKGIASKAILKDGSVKMGAALDVNSNQIVNLADPTLDADAANKKYVDDKILALSGTQNGVIDTLSGKVLFKDGTVALTGDWDINASTTGTPTTHKITGLPTPANDSDAVNKSYVDNKFKVADAMQFKGVANSTDDLLKHASDIEAGWTYKVGKTFTFGSGTTATRVYAGDLLIANADASASVVYSKAELGFTGATWSHVSSGYEAKNASYLNYNVDSNTLYLDDIQADRRGSIKFIDGVNVKSNVSPVAGAAGIEDATVSHIEVGFKLEWGTFGSTAN